MYAQAPTPTPPTTAGGAALTEAEKVRQISQRDDFLLYSIILAGILLACAGLFYFLDRWRKARPDQDREATLSLTSFRQMYENGEITEAEYKQVRDKLAAKMKEKGGVVTVPPGPPGVTPSGGAAVPPSPPADPPTPPPPPEPPR